LALHGLALGAAWLVGRRATLHSTANSFTPTHETPPTLTQQRFISRALRVSKQLGLEASTASRHRSRDECSKWNGADWADDILMRRAAKFAPKKFITVYNFFRGTDAPRFLL